MAHFKKFITVAVALFVSQNGANAHQFKKFASISQQVDAMEYENQLTNENTIQTIADLSLESTNAVKKDDQQYNAKQALKDTLANANSIEQSLNIEKNKAVGESLSQAQAEEKLRQEQKQKVLDHEAEIAQQKDDALKAGSFKSYTVVIPKSAGDSNQQAAYPQVPAQPQPTANELRDNAVSAKVDLSKFL